MTTREVVNELRKRGHRVKVYERVGGGLRITKIDDTRYIGSTGNAVGRSIVGSELSSRQKAHATRLRKSDSNKWNITEKQAKAGIKTGWGFKKKNKTPLPSDIQKELRKVQRKWRKYNVEGSGGTITASNVRYQLEHYGREEALHRIKESERYAEGYAYSDNVKWLVERLRRSAMDSDSYSNEWNDLADYVEAHTDTFREEWINPVLQECYKADKGKPEANIIKNIYSIIGGQAPSDL